VTAIFKELHSVATSTEGDEDVLIDPSGEEQPGGTTVTFEAQPDQGWKFDHWEGDLSGSQNPDSLTVSGPVSVTAVFDQEQYTVDVSKSGQGTVDYAPQQDTYVYGDEIALEASPEVGTPETSEDAWELDTWTGGQITGYEPTFTVTSDANVTARFKTYAEMIPLGYWALGYGDYGGVITMDLSTKNELRRSVIFDQVILYDENNTAVKTRSINIRLFPGEDLRNENLYATRFEFDPGIPDDELDDYTSEWRIEYTTPDGGEVTFLHYLPVSEIPAL